MRLIESIRHSVGLRLLLGFWATIIFALAGVWLLAKWTTGEFEVSKIEATESERLERVARRLTRAYKMGMPLSRLVKPLPNNKGVSVVLYELDTQTVIARQSRFLPRLEKDVERLSEQRTPLVLKRPPYVLAGPRPIQLGTKEYLLFLHQLTPMASDNLPRVAVLLFVLFALSILFSVLFTRSLLRPIRELRSAAQNLAQGDLDARVDTRQFNKDELGELAFVFNDMAQKLGDNWAVQKRLLADVSHELRSPLARLNMAIALAEQSVGESESAQKSFQRIESETAKMDKLIGDVLMLSRTEANIAKRESISLKEVLNDVLHNAEFEASQNGLVFTANSIPQVRVTVQKDALQSAVENIIRNAIRYTKSKVHVHIKNDDKQWSISVEDDGPGLPESQLEKVFAPFYRSDTARDLKTGGTGLGLAIAKASVTAHHGTISARNLATGGLAVTITMAYSNT